MLSAKSSELRIALELAIVDLVTKLKEPSVSALVQKIERLKSAIETGKPFADEVAEKLTPADRAEDIAEKSYNSSSPAKSEPSVGSAAQDTAAFLQKAFLAEEVPVLPETEKLF